MLFLPYFFTAIRFFFFSVFLYTWGFVWFQNKLQTFSKKRIHIFFMCTHTFLCMRARVYVCVSLIQRHVRAGVKGVRVWTTDCEHGFSILLHFNYCCQCNSQTVSCSLVIHSSMQFVLWFSLENVSYLFANLISRTSIIDICLS